MGQAAGKLRHNTTPTIVRRAFRHDMPHLHQLTPVLAVVHRAHELKSAYHQSRMQVELRCELFYAACGVQGPAIRDEGIDFRLRHEKLRRAFIGQAFFFGHVVLFAHDVHIEHGAFVAVAVFHVHELVHEREPEVIDAVEARGEYDDGAALVEPEAYAVDEGGGQGLD